MVWKPLQSSVGKNQVIGFVRRPLTDVDLLELNSRQERLRRLERICRRIDSDNLGARVKPGDQFGGISRTAAKIDHASGRELRNAAQEIDSRLGPFIFKCIARWRRRHHIFFGRFWLGVFCETAEGPGAGRGLVGSIHAGRRNGATAPEFPGHSLIEAPAPASETTHGSQSCSRFRGPSLRRV